MIILSIIILFYNDKDKIDNQNKIDNIIENKLTSKYDGYIYMPTLNKRLLIKKGEYNKVLNDNLVLMISNKEVINKKYGNIILAGHNNKYVFNSIYNLSINDEIIISNFNNEYRFTVYKKEYINIKDKSVLDNVYDKKILTLITCTNNDQTRYIVHSKLNHTISHN